MRRPMPTAMRWWLRSALAGSLLFGGIAVGLAFVDSLPASAATVVQTIGVGSLPEGVSSDGTHVWVTNHNDNTVTELDASTGVVVQTIGVGSFPEGVSSDGTHVWVVNARRQHGDRARCLDRCGRPDHRCGRIPFGVSSDGTHVWVANYSATR